MKTILFVNSCLNQESSRTQRLADAVLDKMLEEAAAAGEQAQVEELSLVDAGIEGLDIWGNDAEAILASAIAAL